MFRQEWRVGFGYVVLLASLVVFVTATLCAGDSVPPFPLTFEQLSKNPLGPAFLIRARSGNAILRPDRILLSNSDGGDASIRFLSPNAEVTLTPISPSPLRTLHFRLGADSPQDSEEVPTYSRVAASSLYPGIDVAYYGSDGDLEFDFLVQPGADPSQIQLQLAGVTEIRMDSRGDLHFKANGTPYRQRAPIAYQVIQGERREVHATLRTLDHGLTYGFSLGSYDLQHPLVIDPILEFASYLTAPENVFADGLQYDRDGFLHVVLTGSANLLPNLDAPTAVSLGDGARYQVLKLDYESRQWVQRVVIYLQGDIPPRFLGRNAVRVAKDGSILGYTARPDSHVLPTVPLYGTDPPSPLGDERDRLYFFKLDREGRRVYVAQLSCSRGFLEYTFDSSPDGEATLVGEARCPDFPLTEAAYDKRYPSLDDPDSRRTFLFRLSADGTRSIASTFLLEPGYHPVRTLAFAPDGDAVVGTSTLARNFPVTAGLLLPQPGTTSEAYLTRIRRNGSGIVWASYFGGMGNETIMNAWLDSASNLHVLGNTYSAEFPVTPNALQPIAGNPAAITIVGVPFLARFSADGVLRYSSFFGPPGQRIHTSTVSDAGEFIASVQGESCEIPVYPNDGSRSAWCLLHIAADGQSFSRSALLYSRWPLSDIALVSLPEQRVASLTSGVNMSLPASDAPLFPTPAPVPHATTPFHGWLAIHDFSSPTQCSAEALPRLLQLPAIGGEFSIRVLAPEGCPWSIHLPSGPETLDLPYGIGPGEFRIRVQPNRNASMSYRIQSAGYPPLEIEQAPPSCDDWTLSASVLALPASGTTVELVIDRPSFCWFTIEAPAPWLRWEADPPMWNGRFDGKVTLRITAPPNAFAPRSTTMTIAGTPVPVTQEGGPCTASASPASIRTGPGASTGALQLSVSGGTCPWDLVAGPGVVASPPSGNSSGVVTLQIAANPYPGLHETFVYVAGLTVPVVQDPGLCLASASPPVALATSASTSVAFEVQAEGYACGWRPAANPGWLRPAYAPEPRAGSGVLQFEVDANPGSSSRDAVAEVLGIPLLVVQAGTQEWLHAFTDAIGGVDLVANGQSVRSPVVLRLARESILSIDIPSILPVSPGSWHLLDWGFEEPTLRQFPVTSEATTTAIPYSRFHRLDVAASTGGTVRLEPGLPGPRMGQLLAHSQTARVTAIPDPGFVFAGWTGAVTSTQPEISISMQTPAVAVARFLPSPVPPGGYARWIPDNFRLYDDAISPLQPVDLLLESSPAGELWEPVRVQCEDPFNTFAYYQFQDTIAHATPHVFRLLPTVEPSILLPPGEAWCTATVRKRDDATRTLSAKFTLRWDRPGNRSVNGHLHAATHGASFSRAHISPNSIFSLFGTNLADHTETPSALPLPTTLAGSRIVLRDQHNQTWDCPLFYVSPLQINALIPPYVPPGAIVVELHRNNVLRSVHPLTLPTVAPGIFLAEGRVAPAATAVLVDGGNQRAVQVVTCSSVPGTSGQFVCEPVAPLGWHPGEQLFISLYATGTHSLTVSDISAQAAGMGIDIPVTYLGPQGQFLGLEQMNLHIPESLRGIGEVPITIRFAMGDETTVLLRF
ncbi:MAG: hypothetical protein KIT83_06790 [Bryobacterales bacterium]|nr:hypothetical protein [Bryobacterales bacterium]